MAAMAKGAAAKESATMNFLYIHWPAVFFFGTIGMICFVDTTPMEMWPPTLELSGVQATQLLTSPWFLAVALPMFAGLLWLPGFVRRNKLPVEEHAAMVWWLTNLFWWHTGCDILSGFFQVMPVLTDTYARFSPAHLKPRWHESRAHLDAGYALELFCEVPFAFIALWLFIRRDPARHIFEVFALGVQFAGTVAYYAPGLAKWEAACWLSWADRSCGFVWLIYPLILLRRHMSKLRSQAAMNGKKKA
jgi:hypothetical protein